MSSPSAANVSILIPCRNEVHNIEQCVHNIYNFDKPNGEFEVIVIDGMSDDGTRDVLNNLKKEYPGLIVIDNPKKTVPAGMNLGIQRARGDYIIRTDVRCIHPKRYILDLLTLSEKTGADNVGGVLEPIGTTYVQKAIAASYMSAISMGGALRHRPGFEGETDAVYGGCFRRERLVELGMYDEEMVRNQDDELSFRIRDSGGKIVQSGGIRVKYYPRRSFKQLFKQFCQYGFWKVFVLKKHPRQASLRHVAPSVFVVILALLGFLAFFSEVALLGLISILGTYLFLIFLESARISLKAEKILFPAIAMAIITIHFAFGSGFLAGLLSSVLNMKPKWFTGLSR